MKHIKRFIVLIAIHLFLALPVDATSATQTVTLSQLGNSLMLNVSNEVTMWESPTLRPGEEYKEAGKLVIENKTDAPQTIELDHVALPFDNDTALSYLNHLYITVREGDTVKYHGTYSRINDEDGIVLSYTMPARSKVELSIDLRCEYSFDGALTGFEGDDIIEWKFRHVAAKTVPVEEKPAAAFSDPALREILVAAGTAVILLVGVGVYEMLRRRRS